MGIRENYQEQLFSPEWREKSREIKDKDNNTCQKCHKKGGTLHVHHKYYVYGRMPWDYPDAAFITLCNKCQLFEVCNFEPNKS